VYAIIRAGGKQYRVKEGDTIHLESLSAAAGEKVVLGEVLLVAGGEVKNTIDLCYQTLALANMDGEKYAGLIRKNVDRLYALQRPDGQWSLLVVNKDQSNAHSVRIVFHDGASGTVRFFSGSTTAIAFGAAQYQWHAKGADGFADPDGPPAVSTVAGTRETLFDLPNASVTVIRGVVGF